MIVQIGPDELISQYVTPFKEGKIRGVHIDYHTNALHGYFGDQEVIIFSFADYGWIASNRTGRYTVTYSTETGIRMVHNNISPKKVPKVQKYKQLSFDFPEDLMQFI